MNNNQSFEIVDITRRAFPKGSPIMVISATNYRVTLRPGEVVVWREVEGKNYFLRNAQWFKKLTIHFVKPEVENNGGI